MLGYAEKKTDGHYKADGTTKWTTDEVEKATENNKTLVEATVGNAFMNKVYYYTCPTCGEAWLDTSGSYDSANGKLVYVDSAETDKGPDADALLGNWFYTDKESDTDTTYNELYVTVEKNATASPSKYTVTTYLRKYTDGVLDLTISDNPVYSDAAISYTGTGSAESPMSLVVTNAVNSENLTLSCVASANATWDEDTKSTDLGAYTVTLGSTISTAATIKKDDTHEHDFALMEDCYQAITENYHYVECTQEGCELTHVKVEHKAGCECRYDSTWKTVTIQTDSSSTVETFVVANGTELTLKADETWTTFGSKEYTIVGVYTGNTEVEEFDPTTTGGSTYKIDKATYIEVKEISAQTSHLISA